MQFFSRFPLLLPASVLGAVSLAMFAGCASSPPLTLASGPADLTTTTGAAVPEAADSPAAAAAPAPPAAKEDAPSDALPGELACRASSLTDGTSELYLTWEGGSAKGYLRRIAPSGERRTQRVRAERYNGAIIVDSPHEQDLTVHVAIVGSLRGKAHLRLGGSDSPWAACQ